LDTATLAASDVWLIAGSQDRAKAKTKLHAFREKFVDPGIDFAGCAAPGHQFRGQAPTEFHLAVWRCVCAM
jgi:hypothetical protein